MNLNLRSTSQYIFYLQLERDLPDHYIRLAENLQLYDISLIPIQLKDLDKISKQGKREHVITVIKDLETFSAFKEARENYFDFGIKSKKYCYYDVSSFESTSTSRQFTHGKSYYHFRLPIEIDDLAIEISEMYLGEKRMAELWPGGKRATLPFDLKRAG